MSDSLVGALSQPVDLASRGVFRVGFGLLAAFESYRQLYDGHAAGLWVEPAVQLAWPGLGWLASHEGSWVFVQLYAQVLLGLAIAAGFLHRVAGVLLAAGCLSLLARDASSPQGALQLIASLSLLLAVTPVERVLSVDTWLGRSPVQETAPAWSLWLLRAQIGIVLLFVGLAMLQGDWLRGYPLRLWLPDRQGLPVLGRLSGSPVFAVGASWVLAIVHLTAPALLLWPRTRGPAFVGLALALFWIHENFFLGTWPWLLLVGATLYLSPSWPRRVFRWPRTREASVGAPPAWVLVAAGLWLAVQLILPLRGALLPGPSAWTGQGEAFAWRIFHASKGGAIRFALTDAESGRQIQVDPSESLTERQYRRLATSPWLARAHARRLAEAEAPARVEVRALGLVTLNGREPQRLIDPTVDLAAPLPDAWILPLEMPLERQWTVSDGWPTSFEELSPGP